MKNKNVEIKKTKFSANIFYLFIFIVVVGSNYTTELHAGERTSESAESSKNNKTDKIIFTAPELIIEGERQLLPAITSNNRLSITDPNLTNQITTNSVYHTFSIHDASVNLIHDEDYDGYYHEFSVSFDPDISTGSAIVYARMYTSLNGGPWNHYFTTKTFEIIGNNDFDYETITTKFTSGYPTGNYDIRIDLFEDGWLDRVAVYGPNEDYDLYNLPLEDIDSEYYYNDHVDVVAAGCSLNPNSTFDPVLPLLFLVSIIYLCRRFYLVQYATKKS